MYTKKNLPKSQFELSTGALDKRFGRDNDIRRDDDSLKLSILVLNLNLSGSPQKDPSVYNTDSTIPFICSTKSVQITTS